MKPTKNLTDKLINVVNPVLNLIDEEGLVGKKINLNLLNESQFESYLRESGVPEQAITVSNGASYKKSDNEFVVTIKEASLYSMFATYFHELGHIATEELVRKSSLPTYKKALLSESLAYSFELYAKEEFNKSQLFIKFADVILADSKEKYLKEMISLSGRTVEHATALAIVYAALKENPSYRDVYNNLKDMVRGQI